jgi:DNA-binding NtrC family response regulator
MSAFIGSHPAIRTARAAVARVASSSCTVLITGEIGTGKTTIAAMLHESSPRHEGPLAILACAAGIEAEIGRQVAAAEHGTLLLDEIGELTPPLQLKVLQLLERRDLDVRIVAATNRDLECEIASGRFREDLYLRLAVVQIALPPLRERAQDIDELALHFFRTARERAGREDLAGFTEEALAAIRCYEWPGNVRSLENAIERCVLLCGGPRIGPGDLPERLRSSRRSGVHAVAPIMLPEEGIDLRAAVDRLETALVKQALERTGNNKNAAANLLRMNRTTLVEMIKRKGL